MQLLMFGAPGVGKGTVGKKLAAAFSLPHISSGEILRREIAHATPIGQSISDRINKGLFVDDVLINEMMTARLNATDCMHGFVLDGWPRNVAQAETLDANLAIKRTPLTKAINITIPEEEIFKRLSKRLICTTCHAVYNEEYLPPNGEHCEYCGGHIGKRGDESAETIGKRLKVYHDVTEPLLDYYSRKSLLLQVTGESSDAVFHSIIEKLKS